MIAWLLVNYNGQESILHNLEVLCASGVSTADIFVVDNGSAHVPDVSAQLISFPENVKFRSVADLSLRYVKNFNKYNSFVIITNSAELISGVKYNYNFTQFMNDEKIGFVVASLVGENVDKYANDQAYASKYIDQLKSREIFHPQPIVTLLNRKYVETLQDAKMAYFNEELVHGWGIDREMRYACDNFGFKGLVTFDIHVKWNNNFVHKLGRAGQSTKEYWTEAEKEMRFSFSRKYGASWEKLFLSEYNKKNGFNKRVSNVGWFYNYFRIIKAHLGS